MSGSFIQSHWPCRTLCPISMFSRIFAAESEVVPASRAGPLRAPSNRTRPITARRRCISIMLSMYRRSRSPRSANVRSRIPSSSSARASSCSSERCARGLSGLSVGEVWAVGVTVGLSRSECDLDRPFGGVDAGADHLTGASVDISRAEVADLARTEPPDACVADAHPAAEGKRGAGLLAGDEDRKTAVALGLDIALQEADRAARPLAGVAADDWLEALHMEQVQVSLALPVLADRVEHRPRAGDVGFALMPVRAEGVELGRRNSTSLAGH